MSRGGSSSPGLDAEKRELRRAMRASAAKAGSDPATRARSGARAAQRVSQLPELRSARCVALYADLPSEMPTDALHVACSGAGLTVLLPRIIASDGGLEFAPAADRENLEPGRYGVLEPRQTEAVPLSSADVVIVPGLAFDTTGGRLGKGGGYYDRVLAGLVAGGAASNRPLLVGFAFEWQIVEQVPCGVLDVRVDVVATEERVVRVEPVSRAVRGGLRG